MSLVNFRCENIKKLSCNFSPSLSLCLSVCVRGYGKTFPCRSCTLSHVFFLSFCFDCMTVSCPPPLKPRDFVLLRSWLDTGPRGEQMLLSRSILHKDYPPKKGYVRYVYFAFSHSLFHFSFDQHHTAIVRVCVCEDIKHKFSFEIYKSNFMGFFQSCIAYYWICNKATAARWMPCRLHSALWSTRHATTVASE